MKKILMLLLLAQNAGNSPAPGVVTGMVRSSTGAPAAGVRVYAMSAGDAKDAVNGGRVLESISETDAAGRYRLEIAPGRYYIAAGSLDSPTYFPGTTDTDAARVFAVTSGTITEAVDFSRFTPAVRSPVGNITFIGPTGTGALSGVIRYPDGSPAAGVNVLLAPTILTAGTLAYNRRAANCSTLSPGPQSLPVLAMFGPMGFSAAVTDNAGRYRLSNVPVATYHVVAGSPDSATLYPGVSDPSRATPITTTPATNLNNLDFTIPAVPAGVAVSGRVGAVTGVPTGGATVVLHNLNQVTVMAFPFLPGRPVKQVTVSPDGSFEIAGVTPGTYCAEARLSGATPLFKEIVVTDQAVHGMEFSFPVSVLSGRVLWEDGTPFTDTQALGDAMVTTVTNPNFVATTMFPIDSRGTFGRVLETGEYRFYLRAQPEDYTIKSMTSGTTDLLKESLKVGEAALPNVEIRMARRTEAAEPNLRGKVLDNVSAKPSTAEQIQLCCLASGPFERYSAPIRSDGSFEFRGVLPGRYRAELRSRTGAMPVNPDIEIGNQGVSEVTIGTMAQSIWVSLRIEVEGVTVPASVRLTVVLKGASGLVPVTGVTASDGLALLVPLGDEYTVSVANLPEGYVVKSIRNGATDLLNGGRLRVTLQDLSPATITLSRVP